MKNLTSYTCTLTPSQAEALRRMLEEGGFEFRPLAYARFSATKPDVNLACYESGKLVVQGKGTREFVEFVLEPSVLREARLGYEAVLDPEYYAARLGVDESGKGDFFGPLCVAGVYVNQAVIESWKDGEIRDSKDISSDRRILELAKLIRETEHCVTTVVPIGNEAYNRLHLKLRSVNSLLAWGHARVIENLLGQMHRMNPAPVKAISDQFANTQHLLKGALMKLGRELELVQRHKAESDVAVAAASILARAEYVTRMQRLSRELGIELPKGASSRVEEVGRQIVERFGAGRLEQVAKTHFQTFRRVVSGA